MWEDVMKISVLTNAYKEEHLIQGCILQFKDFFQINHLVLNTIAPWGSDTGELNDNTSNIAHALGANIYQKNWKTEEDQFNEGLSLCSDSDWVLIVDADERYSFQELTDFFVWLKDVPEGAEAIRPLDWKVYWKTCDYELRPDQPFRPIIAVRPSVRFRERRIADVGYTYAPITLHHFSYVRSDEEMLRKINTFSHKDEIVEGWYNNVWMNWKPEMKNLHPVAPSQFSHTIFNPCPNDIRSLVE